MKAKVTVYLEGLFYMRTFALSGTEDYIYISADNAARELADDYINENDIWSRSEQDLIYSLAGHEIEWGQELCYVVYEDYIMTPPLAVFAERVDAEEFILSEAEDYVYEVMMTEDPIEVFGLKEWDWPKDYRYLLRDAGRTLHIAEVPIMGYNKVRY